MRKNIGQVVRAGKYCVNNLAFSKRVIDNGLAVINTSTLTFTTDQIILNIKSLHQYIDLEGVCGYIEVYGYKARVVNHFTHQMAIEVQYADTT